MSKTVSARITSDLHEALRDRCNKLGCTINEFVSAAIHFAVYGYVEFAFDPEQEDDISKEVSKPEEPKPIVQGNLRVIKLGS